MQSSKDISRKAVSTTLGYQSLQNDVSRSEFSLWQEKNEREAKQELEEIWSWAKGCFIKLRRMNMSVVRLSVAKCS